jgi:hypothetical protein
LVSATHTAGRTAALVRVDSGLLTGPGLDQALPTFDELALGYLADPHRSLEGVPA